MLCPVNYRHGSDGQHFRLNFVKGVIVEMCRSNCIMTVIPALFPSGCSHGLITLNSAY